MSKNHSPSRYNGEMDNTGLYENATAQDISHKMRVPKRITATGEIADDISLGAMTWEYQDKFEMNVPDRILLVGQGQHIGTKAPPREITLENAVLPSDPGMIKVNTPPRVITLDQYYFPSAAESAHNNPSPVGEAMAMPNTNSRQVAMYTHNQNDSKRHLRESTPLGSESMINSTGAVIEGVTVPEEMVHIRRQMARLNRRLMTVEMESVRRQQRERLLAAAGVVYLVIKVIAWLNRN